MHLLRMLADLSFYFTIAGFVASLLGGSGALPGMVLLALTYTLAAFLSGAAKQKAPGAAGSNSSPAPSAAGAADQKAPAALRLLALPLLALPFLLLRASLADMIAMIPPALYVLILILRADFKLDYWQQHRLFSIFWKLVPGLLLLSDIVLSSDIFMTVSLPFALIMLVCSVVLLRSLRHDAAIYTQRRYQMINLTLVAAITGGALLLSTDWALELIGGGIDLVYQNLVVPLLMLIPVLLMLFFYLIRGLFKNVVLDFSPVGGENVSVSEESPIADLLAQAGNVEGPGEALRWFGTALLVAGILAGIVLVFRWMNRRSGVSGPAGGGEDIRTNLDSGGGFFGSRESGPIRGIRSQYRKFLKLCSDSHLLYRKNVTSAEVDSMARKKSAFRELSPEIRSLYIRARYADRAEKEDLQRMKKLLAQARKGTDPKESSRKIETL